jgi:hypothetical protein
VAITSEEEKKNYCVDGPIIALLTNDSSFRLVFWNITPQFFLIVIVILEETAACIFFRIYFYSESGALRGRDGRGM